MICTQVTQISHSTVGSSFSVSFSADTSELDLLNMMHKWFREWNMSGIGFAKIEPQNMASYIIEAYSRGYTDGADAVKAIKDEPQIVVDWKDEMWAEAREQLEKCLADKDEPTISKMEQVDKDINVRSKDCETCKHYKLACELFSEICKYEPTTQTETQNSNLTFEKDECAKEYEELGLKELKELIKADHKTENSSEKPNNCETCKYHDKYGCEYPCDECEGCDKWEQTEPTISKMEQVDKPQMGDAKPIPLSNRVTHIKDEPQTNKDFKVTYTCSFTDCKNFGFNEKCIECKRKQSEARLEDEPQTDCAWK